MRGALAVTPPAGSAGCGRRTAEASREHSREWVAVMIRIFMLEQQLPCSRYRRRALAALTGRYVLLSRPSGEFLKPKRPYQADTPSFGSTTMNMMPMSSEIEIQLLMACSSRTEPIPMWTESSRTASLPMSAAGNSLLPRPEVLLRDTPALQIVAVDRE